MKTFDLERAIAEWKRSLRRNPALEDGQAAELEACLRDEVEELLAQGSEPEAAFRQAAISMGPAADAGAEFYKAIRTRRSARPPWQPPRFVPGLVWSYVQIALRKIRRQKGYSFINIAGMAVGMAACLLIFLWVRDELGFNGFHKNRGRIYLVVSERVEHRGEFYDQTPLPLAEPLREDYPEISKVVRFNFRSHVVARRGEKAFIDWAGAYVDPEVFEVFTFPFLVGDPRSALRDLNGIVLTESAAQKLFGGADPVGQMMEAEGDLVEVKGILRDIPENSDIQVDYFRPFRAMKEIVKYQGFIWNWFSCSTFVEMKEGINPAVVNAKISGLLNTNRPWLKDPLAVSLFAFRDMHLHRPSGGGPIKFVYIFTAVAVMILLMACVNFMNLATARSAMRAKEVALRKVVGSRRSQIVRQFFLESTLFAVLSAVLAVLIALLAVPIFNQLARKTLRLNLSDAGMVIGLITMAAITGVLAGSYPALVLSSFQPADVLKGHLPLHKGTGRGMSAAGAGFRRVMVLIQFVLSIGLMVCALVVFRQLDYMRNGDMGFDKENLVRISIPEKDEGSGEILKAELSRNPNIAGVTAHGPVGHGGKIDWDGATGDLTYLADNTDYLMVDFDYIQTHRMTITAGRDFSREFPSDMTSAYLINEEAVRRWGFNDPVGKRFALVGSPGVIIGVYRNQHFGLKDDVRPCVLYLNSKTPWDRYRFLTVRLKAGRVAEAMADIKRTWRAQITDVPIEYHFVDEMIDALYQSEERLSGLINAFTVLAIAISCLGLFGMASFMAQQRTKEIGVRKVLGASVSRIVFLMTQETLRLVLFAGLVAWPVAFLAMRSWLNDYSYRVKIGADVFIISGLLTLAIALMTVIYQAVKSAVADPVRSLRYE
jgi:putative ABC transport system permease protein